MDDQPHYLNLQGYYITGPDGEVAREIVMPAAMPEAREWIKKECTAERGYSRILP